MTSLFLILKILLELTLDSILGMGQGSPQMVLCDKPRFGWADAYLS